MKNTLPETPGQQASLERRASPRLEIVTIGDELIEGRLVDTHSRWLSDQLGQQGFLVARHTSVGDDRDAIAEVLRQAAHRSPAVLVAGGLGPTTDDLTAEAAAEAFDLKLELFPEALEHVQTLFSRMGRVMSKNNEKQAWLPSGCLLLPNRRGTATGFALDAGDARFYFMPGVPHELYTMFDQVILPDLKARLDPVPIRVAAVRTFGLGESQVGSLLEDLQVPAPGRLVIQYRAAMPEVHVRLCLYGFERWEQEGDTLLAALEDETRRRLGRAIFGDGRQGLAETLLERLKARGETIAAAESCTGGMLGAELTAVPGASDAFLGGVVAYSNALKQAQLGVSSALLEAHGAVSGEVAEAMAAGVRARAGSDWSLAITGVAGPGGGTAEKPVGTVFVALAGASSVSSRKLFFTGDRDRIRRYSTWSALDWLRRTLEA